MIVHPIVNGVARYATLRCNAMHYIMNTRTLRQRRINVMPCALHLNNTALLANLPYE